MFVKIHCAYTTMMFTNNETIADISLCNGKTLGVTDCCLYGDVKVIGTHTLPILEIVKLYDYIVSKNPEMQELQEEFGYEDGSALDTFVKANFEKIRDLPSKVTPAHLTEIEGLRASLRTKEGEILQVGLVALYRIDTRLCMGNLNQAALAEIVSTLKDHVSLYKGMYEQLASYCGLDFSALGDLEVVIEA